MLDATDELTSDIRGTWIRGATLVIRDDTDADDALVVGNMPLTHANEVHSRNDNGGELSFAFRFLLLFLLPFLLAAIIFVDLYARM